MPAGATPAISAAGGSVVATYGAIGVAVVRSDNTAFSATLLKDSNVEGVSATGAFASRLIDNLGSDAPVTSTATPAPGSDSLSALQWDMNQIHSPEARAINGGSPSITVGDIDTGLDFTH